MQACLSSEFEALLAKFTAMEMEINGCKKRTARNYALNDVGVYYIMKTNIAVFARLGMEMRTRTVIAM